MFIEQFPFQALDWSTIEKTEHKGDTGIALWQTVFVGNIRVRMVEYSPGYSADHWCKKDMYYFVTKVKCKQNWKTEGHSI